MPRLYANDPVLHARAIRALDNLRTHTPRGILNRAQESGDPIILGLADGTQQKMTIVAVEPKSFTSDLGDYDKLDVLFAMPTKAAKHFKKAVKRDLEMAALGNKPSPNFNERLRVSKMVFQWLIDESLLARYTLVDGSVVLCRTRSFGYFEVNAEVKGGGEVTLFRHALHRITVENDIVVDMARGRHVQGREHR